MDKIGLPVIGMQGGGVDYGTEKKIASLENKSVELEQQIEELNSKNSTLEDRVRNLENANEIRKWNEAVPLILYNLDETEDAELLITHTADALAIQYDYAVVPLKEEENEHLLNFGKVSYKSRRTHYNGTDDVPPPVVVPAGHAILLKSRSSLNWGNNSGYTSIGLSKEFSVGGLVCSLNYGKSGALYRELFGKQTSLKRVKKDILLGLIANKNMVFEEMFYGCTSLENAPELPETTLGVSCYYNMFHGCTSLKAAPELPATTLASSCYQSMFNGCTSLKTAPKLPATTLVPGCYSNMFRGCTSLETAPELPATKLANSCYQYMFYGCTSLKTAPELPATTLFYSCYSNMFNGCTSLETAPELPATTIDGFSCEWMFKNCSKLNRVKALFTKIENYGLNGWLTGVSPTGTFYKSGDNTYTREEMGIPSGWNVETIQEDGGGQA